MTSLNKLSNITITVFCLAVIAPEVNAAWEWKGSGETVKPVNRERLVLMPLRVGEADKSRQAAMETALIEGLQQKYEVFSGEQVAKKAREIFLKESRNAANKECDETRCLQGIAEAFQAELIATANVSRQQDGYFLAISIQNIFDNKVVYSKSVPCKKCDAYQVVDKLKELSGAPAAQPVARKPETASASSKVTDPEMALWEEVQKGNSAEDYGAYLAQYPKGKYAELANIRISKHKEQAAPKTVRQEQSAWDKASKALHGIVSSMSENKEATGEIPVMVRVPGKKYEIGKYEVTQGQWKAIMGNNPSYFNKCGDDCPIEQVSWNEIQQFIMKLNAKTGKKYRLPSEVEWKYACYGGKQTVYCGNGDIDVVGWYGNEGQPGGNSGLTTHPVGQKQANDYGLYDMTGNVSEWTSSCMQGFCGARIALGGSWLLGPPQARTETSLPLLVERPVNFTGFRLVRMLP